MKILLVTSDFPFEEIKHSGGQLTFNWFKHLSRSHEVSLLSFIREEEEPFLPDARRYFKEVRTVPARRGWRSRLLRIPLLFTRPYPVVATHSPELSSHLREMLSETSFDLVQFEYFHMGQYAALVPESIPRVLVLQDVVTPVLRQQVRIAPGLKKYYYYREHELSGKFEKLYASRAGNIFTLSPKDKIVVESWGIGVNCYVLPVLLNERLFQIRANDNQPGNIIFLGAMHRLANQDAARRLKQDILPLVSKKLPGVRCFIVGHHPPLWIKKMSSENFIVTGAVERIEPYLSRASILVAPLRVAGGIIIKILQAMAAGRPVLASRVANAGIGAEEGKEIMIADRTDDFAGQLLGLLKDTTRARTIGRAGRRFVQKQFDPESAKKKIDAIYGALNPAKVKIRSG
jgi:glycosyltransferase involved in cell wall biosynthesis